MNNENNRQILENTEINNAHDRNLIEKSFEDFEKGRIVSEEQMKNEFGDNALNPVKQAALDEKERYWAQRAEEHRWDIDSAVHTGYEKGIQKGIEQTIRNMFANGLDYQTILSIVGQEQAETVKHLEQSK